MKKYLVGVDLGTNGLKVALFDLEGNVQAETYLEMSIQYPGPGLMEQDPDEFYMGTFKSIRAVLDSSDIDPGSVLAVGFDGQMGGVIGIDESFDPVTHYDIVLDTRCQKYNRWIKENYEDILFERSSGTWSHAAKILWWKNERRDAYKKIKKFVLLAGYVGGKMAGLNSAGAYVDYTSLFCSGLHETVALTWSDEICGLLGIDDVKLPAVVKPWDIIGKVDSVNAKYSGLLEGTPIVAGAGDQSAGFLGAGVIKPGMAIDVAGSTSVFSLCTDEFIPDLENKQIVYFHSVLPDLYYPLTYISGGGICIRWFKENFAHREKQEAEKEGVDVLAFLDEKCRSIEPGSGELLFMPHLGGRYCPNEPEVRGAWVGLNWGHTSTHLYRSILESIAYDYSGTLTIFKQLFPNVAIDSIRVTGGGSRSDLWNQIKSDILNIPYVRLDKNELAVLGSAIIAGFGAGAYDNLEKSSLSITSETDRVSPDKKRNAVYKKYIHNYAEMMDCLQPVFHSLSSENRPDNDN
jgi:xylulokinase